MSNIRIRIISFLIVSILLSLPASAQWISRGGPLAGAGIVGTPNCVTLGPNRIDCLARGSDNAMHHTRWDGRVWSGWESLGGPIDSAGIASDPMCLSAAPNRFNCFVRGSDGAMHEKWWTGTHWRGWESHGGGIVGAPNCVSWGLNRVDCFVRGTDDAMYHTGWNGSAWSGWGAGALGGPIVSKPNCVTWAANRIDCFARGASGAMQHRWWNGCSWNNPIERHSFGPVPYTNLVLIPSAPDDRDGDGLPDRWEEDRSSWGLNPDRADLILVPVLRPNASYVDVEDNINKTIAFFQRVPVRSYNGEIGINVVVRPGRPLDNSFREDATPFKEYPAARIPGMPPELVGYGHGLLIGTGCGGGGQTERADWAGVANGWLTFVHELGHQLGLQHDPLSSPVASPLYTSIMSYSYSYGFDGDPYKVHFSRGKFASIRLNEASLNETLPFSSTEMTFLTKHPYNFEIRPDPSAPLTTQIDFNRNKAFGESNVSADINDGYALVVKERPSGPLPKVMGDVALAAMGDSLIGVATELRSGAAPPFFHGKGATAASPGRLVYYTMRGGRVIKTGRLFERFAMTGAPSVLANTALNMVLIAYPTDVGYVVSVYRVEASGALVINDSTVSRNTPVSPGAQPGAQEVYLVSTSVPGRSYVVTWNAATNKIATRELTSWAPLRIGPIRQINWPVGGDYAVLAPILSYTPPSAVYDTKLRRLILLTTDVDGATRNRLKLWELVRTYEGGWVGYRENYKWVAGANASTSDRPAIVFDDRPTAGPHGRYLIYFRRDGVDASELRGMDFVRLLPPLRTVTVPEATAPYIYRHVQVINEWSTTRNAPAVVKFQGDFWLGWRVGVELSNPDYNKFAIMAGASGEFTSGMTDFDDVTYIATHGLRESLIGVRR